METELFFPNITIIDDACDWTPVIIWRMNAGARARSCSAFEPCPRPAPVLGLTPKVKPAKAVKNKTRKPVEKVKTAKLSAPQLVAIMKGRKLSYHGILTAIEKHHPDINITAHQLRKRVACMLSSNLVGIIQHDDTPIPYFTLQSVDPKFYSLSTQNMPE